MQCHANDHSRACAPEFLRLAAPVTQDSGSGSPGVLTALRDSLSSRIFARLSLQVSTFYTRQM